MLPGIDIYHGDDVNAGIITSMTKNHQLYFAFIKTGTGARGKDSMFPNYWGLCRKAGLVCGAYHWFWPTSDATEQAVNFLTQYRAVNRSGVLPPVVDIEWTWSAGDTQTTANELWNKVSPSHRIPKIREYLTKVATELNVKPVIYTAASFWKELLQDHASADDNNFFSSCSLWIADPNNNGRLPMPWRNSGALFTQTHFGESAESSDPFDKTDQNAFKGSLLQFLNSAVAGLTFSRGFPFSFVIKGLQQALKTKGFLADEADGFFGQNSETAITAFQISAGLVGNGIVDAQTWNKLLA
jgi:GH25 family lysozyme M1 (1,4-beta-N-acetylmuramidase)